MMNLDNSVQMNGMYRAEYYDVQSKRVGDTLRVYVAPPGAVVPGKRYPVVYVLDGNLFFASVTEAYRAMAMGGEVPPAIIVGVGYPSNDPADAVAKRYRDYTPSRGGEVERIVGSMSQPSGTQPAPGGGPRFAQFLQQELKPGLEARYPVDPDHTTLIGVSLGGLLAAWTLLSVPAAFRNYVLCSPSLWWNREEVWTWDKDHSEQRTDLAASVFLSAGSLETAADSRTHLSRIVRSLEGPMREGLDRLIEAYDRHGWPRMSELTTEFAQRLAARGYPGLKIRCHNMPEESHTSVAPGAITRGLRYISGSWVPS
jgi:hypothetical protein